jgi:alpha-L-rhamnosidase
VVDELKPVALTEPRPGVYVYDLGQNMVGWVRMRLSGPSGGSVQFRHAEMLNDDGTLYTANLRGAPQIDRYILAGRGVEFFEPRFTYHGFRYVEVTGALRKPSLGDLVGRVFCSSSPETGRFECSSPMLTRLMRNAFWTQRANLMSTPTDCPQRDERLGWMGDIQSFSQSAIFNMDLAAFFTKWLQDVRDAQLADGRMPDFAPNPAKAQGSFSGVPAWGDAGVIVPWRAWVNYGDRRILEASFGSCRRWLDYVRRLNPDLIWRNGRNNDYNDWLNGDTLILEGWPRTGGAVPNEVFATAFFAHSTDLTRRMAEALGRKKDAAELREQWAAIKAAFVREFVQPDGTIRGDTQAGYALALHFDLLPEDLRPKAVERLVAAIHRYRDHVSTGIQSTHRMMLELSRWDHSDLAYTLANRTDFPSWGFMIENGATTIWERWDGYVKGRGFQDPGMNSFNHWALGSVVEWLWRTVVGISPDESAPGWRRFHVRPIPGGGLTWARGEYASPAGRIALDWRIEAGALILNLTVPPNTQAVVEMPGAGARTVGSGRHEFRAAIAR